MVKCSRCGVDVGDSSDICPNCGNSLNEPQKTPAGSNGEIVCSNCGTKLTEDDAFCSICGTKVEEIDDNKCEMCGSEIPENVLFCPTCGTKVKQKEPSKQTKACPKCGFNLEGDSIFCPECGTKVTTGSKPENQSTNPNQSFVDKININSIIKPAIITFIVSIVLSSIGLLIGLSWISFILAIVLSVGFFAGLVDNEANAVVMGFVVGLVLGLLETPLVEFWYGFFAAGLYDWLYGGQIILLIILGIICAYVSNVFLKKNIQDIAGNFASRL